MENKPSLKLNQKKVNNPNTIYNQRNSFFIRRRKTFLIDQNTRIYKKESNKKINTFGYSSLKTFHNQKTKNLKKPIRKKISLALSTKDFKEIEEDIRYSIIEMRKTCLWELRHQSQDLLNIFGNIEIKDKNQNELNKCK